MSNELKIGGIVAISMALLASGFAAGYVVGNGTAQAAVPDYYGPGGMMWGFGGMMGQYGPGGMMSGTAPGAGQVPQTGDTSDTLTLDGAVEVAEAYIEEYGGSNLELAEVMQFDNHFYAQAREVDTGINAFEILIDPHTAAVFPEPGPNMMWNTKYGMMRNSTGPRGSMMGRQGGMMGGYTTGDPEGEMSVSPSEARELAQAELDSSLPGTTVDDEVDEFYGYYTIHVLREGRTIGMLSVNGYTGQVWLHTWHGEFVDMTEHAHD
jgi:hypothetical protein